MIVLEHINKFIVNQYNNNLENIDDKALKDFISKFFLKIININNFLDNDFKSRSESQFLENLLLIISLKNKELILEDNKVFYIEKIIKEVNELINQNKLNESRNITIKLLIPLFKISPENAKLEINKIVKNIISTSNFKHYNDINLFYLSLFNDIVIDYSDIEKQAFLKYIESIILNKKKEEAEAKEKIERREPVSIPIRPSNTIYLNIISSLLRTNKLTLDEITSSIDINNIKDEEPFFDFLVSNKENFDYSKFNPEWIKSLTDEEFASITENNDLSKKILNKLRDEMLKENFKN